MKDLLTIVMLLAAAVGSAAAGDVTVAVDPKVTYQTIRGWSANPWYPHIAPGLRDQVVDAAVNDLGLTRVRWGQPIGNRWLGRSWEWRNDDGDPYHVTWSAFNTETVDRFVGLWVKPFKERVEANGDPFELWVSPSFFDGGSTGSCPAWIENSPAEYAEFATSFLTYLKEKHGIEATHYVILNEAGNNNRFSPARVAEMIRELGPRLKALGLRTTIQFPDGVNAGVSWRYIQHVKDDPDVLRHVTHLSYHLYGAKDPFRARIRAFAKAHGMVTGQTEYMHLSIDHLYDDLTKGGVSYWSIYGLAGAHAGAGNFRVHLSNTAFDRGRRFWTFRQVMRYVRPGDVRVEAASGNAAVRALAFARDGRVSTVLINTGKPRQARRVIVRGLPAGRYGVCRSVGGRPYEELGVRPTDPPGMLAVTVPANAVLTAYPYGGRNLPPTVTDWRAHPVCLTIPASKAVLTVSATDPEGDRLTFDWAVTGRPPHARVRLSAPKAARTEAAGLTEPGAYAFTAAVSDGEHAVRRTVLFKVFKANQPPITIDVHNRIPVTITHPDFTTLLRGGAHDMENDPVRMRWLIVRQPPKGTARLEPQKRGACKALDLFVPGDYVFRFEVRDPTHVVTQDLTVPVYPLNGAPAITRIAAVPERVSAAAGRVRLTAATSDPDGDVITHWWSVRAPAGSAPAFDKRAAAETDVKGLTVPGRYVFTLRVIDRTKVTRKDVVVTVMR